MIRLCSLLLFCLLTLTRADAQTDTTRPPAGQQDSVRRLSPADSLRRDSLTRVRKARRDSLRLVRLAAKKDSLAAARKDSIARAATQAAPKKDSVSTAATLGAAASPPTPPAANTATSANTATAAPASAKPPAPPPAIIIREGPPVLSFWQKVLASNPYFNFT